MLNIEVGFGFAVELFVFLFCGICCFFYTPAPVESKKLEVIEESIATEEKPFNPVFEEIDFQEPSLETIIETLSWAEAKSVVSVLRNKKLTSAKLAGKGTGGTYFQEVIKTLLSDFEGDVRSVIEDVLSLKDIPA